MDRPRISIITPSIRPEGLAITQKCLKEQTFTDFEWIVEIGLGTKHDFNAAMNRMIRRANGELIVILQDYISVDADYLQRFWDAYKANPDTFFTSPVGKVDNLAFHGNPKWDWRNYKGGETGWQNWEIDSGACPKVALFKIGGFDEELDKFWSFDNVNVGYRANMAGYKFANLVENQAVAYDHDAFIEHPFRKDFNPAFHNARLDEFARGLKIDYLTLRP